MSEMNSYEHNFATVPTQRATEVNLTKKFIRKELIKPTANKKNVRQSKRIHIPTSPENIKNSRTNKMSIISQKIIFMDENADSRPSTSSLVNDTDNLNHIQTNNNKFAFFSDEVFNYKFTKYQKGNLLSFIPQIFKKKQDIRNSILNTKNIPTDMLIPQICSKSVYLRSVDESTTVLEWLKKIKFIQDLPISIQNEIASCLVTEVYLPGEYLCHEGDIGESAFFLYDGIVQVLKNQKHLLNFKSGDIFGTQALDNDTKRTATLIAKEKSYVLVLSKKDYKEIIGHFVRAEKADNIQFLRYIPAFQNFSFLHLQKICNNAIIGKFFKKDKVLFTRGETTKNIYVIKTGKCLYLNGIEIEVKNKWPVENNKWEEKKVTKIFEVSEYLGSGEALGLEDILAKNSKYTSTAITAESCYLFAISVDDVLKYFPNDEERNCIFKIFIENNQTKKEALKEQVLQEMKLKSRARNVVEREYHTRNNQFRKKLLSHLTLNKNIHETEVHSKSMKSSIIGSYTSLKGQ